MAEQEAWTEGSYPGATEGNEGKAGRAGLSECRDGSAQDRERIKREEGRTIGAMKEIAALLGLPAVSRVEAFDISNISGFQSVGSMVVYEKGKPKRSDYRKFRIKLVQGANDYASMEEVLTRRFTRGLEEQEEAESCGGFCQFPDLIMMDGGRGQVNIALEVLDRLKLSIPVCGMVKDDKHRTRGLYFNNEEIPIDHASEGFKLITRIQDEAHRFAIEYHRLLRSKGQVHSILDDIAMAGEKKRSDEKISVSGCTAGSCCGRTCRGTLRMNLDSARKVYHFFHGDD